MNADQYQQAVELLGFRLYEFHTGNGKPQGEFWTAPWLQELCLDRARRDLDALLASGLVVLATPEPALQLSESTDARTTKTAQEPPTSFVVLATQKEGEQRRCTWIAVYPTHEDDPPGTRTAWPCYLDAGHIGPHEYADAPGPRPDRRGFPG